MVSVFFNELSVYPLCDNLSEAKSRLLRYSEVVSLLKERVTNLEIRYQYNLFHTEIMQGQYVGNVCLMLVKEAKKEYNNDLNKLQYLLYSQHNPYIKEDELSEQKHKEYDTFNVYVNISQNNLIAEGFKAAFLMDSICVGFLSDSYWDNTIHNLVIEDTSTNTNKSASAICVSDSTHLNTSEVISWCTYNAPIELLVSNTPLQSKLGQHHKTIGKHHGKEILYAHAKKLIQSPYVDKIISSAEYGSPHDNNYIAEYDNNGIIRIMLTWEEPKVSMLIQTTGRNEIETKKIAEILTQQFSE